MKLLRFALILVSLVVLALLLHIPVYGTTINLETISNVLFVVGVITFLPSLIVTTGAYQVFQGITYVFKSMFGKNTRQEFPTFRDYKEHHSKKVETTFFKEALLASGIVLLAGMILAIIALSQY